jgi:hypothetical protein
MKILELQINNIKRIRAIEINPATGEPVILTGDNANGKSSVLDAIILALSNRGLIDPIRHGSASGEVKIVLGCDKAEYTITRKLTRRGDYLSVVDEHDRAVPKAQTFLNGLLGNYAFDPLEFVHLKPKEQVDALKSAAGLDFDELDANRASLFAQRTEVGRQGKESAGHVAALTAPPDGIPDEEVSASEAMATLQALQDKSLDHSRKAAALDQAKNLVATATAEVDRLKEALRVAEEAKAKAEASVKVAEATLAACPPAEQSEIEAAKAAVAALDETNQQIRDAKKYRKATAKAESLRKQYASLTDQIAGIDAEKSELVKSCRMPVDGLELTDDGVMFNGVMFSQLSTAEQIRISVLVAMAQNPELRIILIREGALMNRSNLAMISDLARGEDYQLWIEKFQEDASESGLHIVDGAIAFVDGKEVES